MTRSHVVLDVLQERNQGRRRAMQSRYRRRALASWVGLLRRPLMHHMICKTRYPPFCPPPPPTSPPLHCPPSSLYESFQPRAASRSRGSRYERCNFSFFFLLLESFPLCGGVAEQISNASHGLHHKACCAFHLAIYMTCLCRANIAVASDASRISTAIVFCATQALLSPLTHRGMAFL